MVIRFKKQTAILTAFFLLACVAFSYASGDGDARLKVTFPGKAKVNSEKILLGRIAYITGPDTALKQDLSDVFITKAPKPGKTIKIRKKYIEHKLAQSGLPLDQFDWQAPLVVQVSRQSQTVSLSFIKNLVKKYLAKTEPYKSREWELLRIKTGSLKALPSGKLTYKLTSRTGRNPGYLNLRVFFIVNGKEAGQTTISAKVKLYGNALVAARRINKGRVLNKKDLRLTRVDTTSTRKGFMTKPDQALGMAAKRLLEPGRILLFSDVVKNNVVKKGDSVTIVAESGNMRVTAIGLVMEDGAIGEKISVKNPKSKKILTARVVNSTLVRIDF